MRAPTTGQLSPQLCPKAGEPVHFRESHVGRCRWGRGHRLFDTRSEPHTGVPDCRARSQGVANTQVLTDWSEETTTSRWGSTETTETQWGRGSSWAGPGRAVPSSPCPVGADEMRWNEA